MTIDILPDDVLLEIFSFYLVEEYHIETWHTLVHICQRWRTVVLASPLRLDLQICCTLKTRVKDMLDIWPALPLVIQARWYETPQEEGADNIVAALEHNDRIREIILDGFPKFLLQRFAAAAATQELFPALTRLIINASDDSEQVAVFSETFLGGSAPQLRSCHFRSVAIMGIQSLLSTANHLVYLSLPRIPHSTYISPEEMATCLTAMPDLKELGLGFQSPRSRPHPFNRRLPPPARVVLPALTHCSFKVVSEYIEDLVSRIEAPLLESVHITFFNQLIFESFDTPRLGDFLAHTQVFREKGRASVVFDEDHARFHLKPRLSLGIACTGSDWQLSSMAQVCSLPLPFFSTLEHLYICEGRMRRSRWQDDMENTQWLELLHPFIALKDLYLDKKIAPRVVLALKEHTQDTITENLPVLQNLFIEGLRRAGPVQEVIGQFVAVRQLAGLPVTVHKWDGQS